MITFDFDTKLLEERLGSQKKQARFAIQETINTLLFDLQKQAKKEVMKFDGGATPFTQKAFMVRKASKRKLIGELYIQKNRPYLVTLMRGGVVRPRLSKFGGTGSGKTLVMPGTDMRKNKYGNMPQKYIKRRMPEASKSFVGPSKPNSKFFIGHPQGQSKSDKNYGMYQRTKTGLKLLVYMGKRKRTQRIIFPMDDISQKYVTRYGSKVLQRNIKRALETAR